MFKNIAAKYAKYVALGSAAIGGLLMTPLAHASCLSMTCGLVVPEGTTTNFTSAVETYLWTPVKATMFQSQVIQILVVLVAVALILGCAYAMMRAFRLRR